MRIADTRRIDRRHRARDQPALTAIAAYADAGRKIIDRMEGKPARREPLRGHLALRRPIRRRGHASICERIGQARRAAEVVQRLRAWCAADA
jgi:hypothetical protein